MATRKYDSALRGDQATLTRQRILDAAYRLLIDSGYPAMTNTALAAAAEVSPQTVYNAVGNKAAVLKAVYDRTLAGDDEPIPVSERAEVQAVRQAPNATEMLRAYAHVARTLVDRVGPILAVLFASAGDDELRALADTIDGERLIGNTLVVRALAEQFGLPDHLSPERARDIVWTLTAPDPWHRLVVQQGWTPEEYEQWLAKVFVRTLT